MKNVLLASSAALGLAFSLACGGGGAALSGGADNVGACKAYIEHYNSLDCSSIAPFDANEMCPDALDMNPTDMTPFYECMASSVSCKDGIPDFGSQSDCSM